ncbi:MAG TPA: phosphatidate cytidylyltransferase [Candidatus Angelobacter sp.]|jgi:phosphatidate cytidylyltransferase
MKRVLTAAALIPVVLLLVFRAPLWLFALMVAAIVVLALREYLTIAEAAGIKAFRWPVYLLSVLPFLLLFYALRNMRGYSPGIDSNSFLIERLFLTAFWIVAFLSPILFGTPLIFRKNLQGGLAAVAASIFGLLYVSLSLSLLIKLRVDFFECTLVPLVLFSVWAGDIAAYYVGRAFGKHKLAPIVSPNKSWEGAIASTVASVGIALLMLHFRFQIAGLFRQDWGSNSSAWTSYVPLDTHWLLIHSCVLGILTNLAAQCGDLFESALKRGAGVKDSGTLLPGHGGVLDRIDALLFAIPVVWYYARLTGFLQPEIFK